MSPNRSGEFTGAASRLVTVLLAGVAFLTAAPAEAVVVAFSTAASSASEAAGTASLDVTLSNAILLPVTVDYAVTGGTATGGGADYTLAAGTLTFAPGQTARTVDVIIVDDPLDEIDETVIVTLSNPSRATLGATAVHTLTITDSVTSPFGGGCVPSSGSGSGVGAVLALVALLASFCRSRVRRSTHWRVPGWFPWTGQAR